MSVDFMETLYPRWNDVGASTQELYNMALAYLDAAEDVKDAVAEAVESNGDAVLEEFLYMQRAQGTVNGLLSPYWSVPGGGESYLPPQETFATLGDVSLSGLTNGQVPVWNATAGKWENGSVAGGGTMESMTDVLVTSVSNGEILAWNSGASKWENVSPYFSFESLTDVQITSIANGQVPVWNSTSGKWVNTLLSFALDALSNVSISSVQNGQVLTYNSGTGKWVNATPANATVTMTGDVTGSGTTSIATSLQATSNVRSIINSIRGGSVWSATDPQFGALFNGSANDTAAINAAILAAHNAGGGVVLCPAGTAICSGIVIYGGVFIIGVKSLTSFKAPANATDMAVIMTNNFASLYNTDSSANGEYRFGLFGITVDCNYTNQTQKVILPPLSVTATPGSGGSLASGTYAVVITAYNSFGESDPSNAIYQTITSGQQMTLSWGAVTGATGYHIYAYNLSGGGWSGEDAVFQASTTSTTYTLSSYTSSGHTQPQGRLNTSALCGMLIWGADYDIADCDFYHAPSINFWSGYNDNTSTGNQFTYPNDGMEARIVKSRFWEAYRHNFCFFGPHDSIVQSCFAYFPEGAGNTSDNAQSSINMLIDSTVHVTNVHVYGSAAIGIRVSGQSFFIGCTAEGANVAQVEFLEQCSWVGGNIFPSVGANSVAIRVGNSSSVGWNVLIVGVWILGFSGTSGNVAFDLTNAGPNQFISAMVQQSAGDIFLDGIVPSDSTIFINASGGCTPSVNNVLSGTTQLATVMNLLGHGLTGVSEFVSAVPSGGAAPNVTAHSGAGYRTDTATVTSGSATVLDASITSADQGSALVATASIPNGTYVGTVTAGTSFLLSSSPTSQVNVTATANDTSVLINNATVTAFGNDLVGEIGLVTQAGATFSGADSPIAHIIFDATKSSTPFMQITPGSPDAIDAGLYYDNGSTTGIWVYCRNAITSGKTIVFTYAVLQ